jgi:hypothetical protein
VRMIRALPISSARSFSAAGFASIPRARRAAA